MKMRLSQLIKKIRGLSLIDSLLLLSFFLSGCSALIYQVGWQRALYGVIGVDIDSITIIVSVFMLGIGFGGMLGGWIADRFPRQRIHFYAAVEFSIAVYGLFSLMMLTTIGDWLMRAGGGGVLTAGAGFTFFLLPTTLMGVTLPLLTLVFNEWRKNIGVSVGQLYFVNTFGAAAGAGLVPFVLLPLWPLDKVILTAVIGNVMVAVIALSAFMSHSRAVAQTA